MDSKGNDYYFFCRACLIDKTEAEMSPDTRYCLGCYEFLLKEAEILGGTKRPAWIPKPQKPLGEPAQSASCVGHNNTGTQMGSGIMSTVKGKKYEVDNPPTRTKGRGPKHRLLPEDLIAQLSGEGMGSKAIAAKLKDDFGTRVSYKTIQRRLSAMKKEK